MKPTGITYRRLFSFGEYQNETIGCDLALAPNDDPDEALSMARRWVEAQHAALEAERGRQSEVYDLEQKKRDLEYGMRRIKDEADVLRAKAVQCAAFLIQSGLHPVRVPSWLSDAEISAELAKIAEQRDYYTDRSTAHKATPIDLIGRLSRGADENEERPF